MKNSEIEILAEEIYRKIEVSFNNLSSEDGYKLAQNLLNLVDKKRSFYGAKLCSLYKK